jgi:hypothetical protein
MNTLTVPDVSWQRKVEMSKSGFRSLAWNFINRGSAPAYPTPRGPFLLLVSGSMVSLIAILGSTHIPEPLIILLLLVWVAIATKGPRIIPRIFLRPKKGYPTFNRHFNY